MVGPGSSPGPSWRCVSPLTSVRRFINLASRLVLGRGSLCFFGLPSSCHRPPPLLLWLFDVPHSRESSPVFCPPCGRRLAHVEVLVLPSPPLGLRPRLVGSPIFGVRGGGHNRALACCWSSFQIPLRLRAGFIVRPFRFSVLFEALILWISRGPLPASSWSLEAVPALLHPPALTGPGLQPPPVSCCSALC